MSKSVVSALAEEYARVRESLFPRVHGRPALKDYLKLKNHDVGVSLGANVGYFDWTTCVTGTTYGLMGDVLGAKEYEDINNIPQADYDGLMTKPTMYDASINAGTSDYQRDKKSKIHDELVRWWYMSKGFHRGMRENFVDA